jgi:hypothetical protein
MGRNPKVLRIEVVAPGATAGWFEELAGELGRSSEIGSVLIGALEPGRCTLLVESENPSRLPAALFNTAYPVEAARRLGPNAFQVHLSASNVSRFPGSAPFGVRDGGDQPNLMENLHASARPAEADEIGRAFALAKGIVDEAYHSTAGIHLDGIDALARSWAERRSELPRQPTKERKQSPASTPRPRRGLN